MKWEDVNPGDWVRAQSRTTDTSFVEGIVDDVKTHDRFAGVFQIDGMKRATINWKLVEVIKHDSF